MTFNLIPWNRPHNNNVRRERTPYPSLQNEINRVFDDFFGNDQTSSLLTSAWHDGQLLSPVVDILETENSLKVEAELPGIEEGDIEVTVNENYLILKGEKKESKEEKEENYVRRERYYGAYERTIALPETADTEGVKATFNNGILSIEIPKKEEAVKKSRKVEISSAA